MLPTKRGEVRQQFIRNVHSSLAEGDDGALEISGIPQDNCGDDQVEAGGAVLLVFIGSITDLAEAMQEHGTRQAVAGLALVELLPSRAAQFGIVDPVICYLESVRA